jgi:hypothetical protein
MSNLWILTEERPKISVIREIISLYKKEYNVSIKETELKIKPRMSSFLFEFVYDVEGISIDGVKNIYIKTVSGSSSFFDFLVFYQEHEPEEGNAENGNLIFAIEETKTSDGESRNTGVYQRGSKFVYIDLFHEDVKKIMLYNDQLEDRVGKKPSDTSIFGTNMLLTLGVDIVGKRMDKWFSKFNSLDELITFKNNMRKPPAGNVPVEIKKFNDRIEVSGRLAKPKEAGNIGHDPNIGALSLISKTIRHLGWEKDIVITEHGVSQQYVDKTKGKNKFLFICNLLNIKFEGLTLPKPARVHDSYWHYEKRSEKHATIFLHVLAEYNGIRSIYENHAGCERGYFKTKEGQNITLAKKDYSGENLYIPDLILYESKTNHVCLIEGKMYSTWKNGVEEINNYDSIENEVIEQYYPGATVERWVTLFGENHLSLPHEKVLLYLNSNGIVELNPKAPKYITNLFGQPVKEVW